MSATTHAIELLVARRQLAERDAELWARRFLPDGGECAAHCTHTAREHGEARELLAAVFLDLLAELRIRRNQP